VGIVGSELGPEGVDAFADAEVLLVAIGRIVARTFALADMARQARHFHAADEELIFAVRPFRR
jgi:hypothetical protein